MKIGENVRRIRLMRNMKQGFLESAAGLSAGNLSRIERDEQGYTGDVLTKLAEALKVNVKDFFADPDTPLALPNLPHQSLGQRFALARKKRGITQDQVAEVLNITKAAISGIENDKSGLAYQHVFPCADFLKVSARWLLTGVNDEEGGSESAPRPVYSPIVERVAEKIAVLPKERLEAWATLIGIKL